MQTKSLFLGAALALSTVVEPAFATGMGHDDSPSSQWREFRGENRDGRRCAGGRTQARSGGVGGILGLLFGSSRPCRNERPDPTPPASRSKPQFFTYQPEPLVPLNDERLEGELSENTYSRWVFDVLRVGVEPRLRSEAADRAAILAFYKQRKFEPVWVGDYGLNLRARRLVDALARAHEDGLTVSRYLPSTLTSFRDVPEDLFDDPYLAAELEIGLTAKALKFARHASGGQVVANRLGRGFDLESPSVEPAEALDELARTLHPEEYLDSLHPSHPVYLQLKRRLAREREAIEVDRFEPIGEGDLIRAGSEDARIPLIRARLKYLGFLDSDEFGDAAGRETRGDDFHDRDLPVDADGSEDAVGRETRGDDFYGRDLVEAVKEFQDARRLKRDGVVGPRTIAALNERHAENLVEKIELNMERMRWLTRSLGKRHVLVNQAAFMAEVIDDGRKIHQMRVIVGKPRHPTPIFSDEMETVVFNPYWHVPKSIVGAEMLPHLWNDPAYLDRKGFQVIDRQGRRISSRSVDWWNHSGQSLPYSVRQPPSRANALGEIKFLFPNKHAVYMHDTPKRNLFSNDRRAFSHGCVRIQDPRKFAQIVLGWSADRVADAVEAGENRRVSLPGKIPVHMTYFTMWPDDSGKLASRDDLYKRDDALKRALSATRIALN